MNRILQVALLPLLKQSVIKNGGNQCRQFSFNINRFKSLGIRSFGTTAPFKNEDEDKIEQFLKEHSITVKGCDAPPILSFEDCAIPKNILSHLLSQFEKPTPIQSQALPIALEGRNMVGIGQTGSGKTLAFLLPALAHIQKVRETKRQTGAEYRGPIALVLSPTSELALQIMEVANLYRNASRVSNVCCIGGDSRTRQLRNYDRRPELMIATPGRLRDFLQSREMSVSDVEYVVLDEADRMLDMGFEPQIRAILEELKPEKQVLMFSATWPSEVKELAEDFLGEYTFMNIGSTELRANKNIKQEVIVCDEAEKHNKFVEKLQELKDKKVLIFAEKKITVDRLERVIRQKGIHSMGIHGDKSQTERTNVIRGFKQGHCKIMIATDVAARGLDISNVEYVINYDFPKDIENYVHRIGRTGRSDKKGTSVTFMSEEDSSLAGKLIKILKEGDQEIPQELVDLSRYSSKSKFQKQRYGTPSGGKRNDYFNKGFQSNQDREFQTSRNRDYVSSRSRDYESSRDEDYQDYRSRESRSSRKSFNRPRDDSDPFY